VVVIVDVEVCGGGTEVGGVDVETTAGADDAVALDVCALLATGELDSVVKWLR
jgi:hypothetical protein